MRGHEYRDTTRIAAGLRRTRRSGAICRRTEATIWGRSSVRNRRGGTVIATSKCDSSIWNGRSESSDESDSVATHHVGSSCSASALRMFEICSAPSVLA